VRYKDLFLLVWFSFWLPVALLCIYSLSYNQTRKYVTGYGYYSGKCYEVSIDDNNPWQYEGNKL